MNHHIKGTNPCACKTIILHNNNKAKQSNFEL